MSKISDKKEALSSITCNEARLLLKVTDANKCGTEFNSIEMAAIRHYHDCHECKELSLSEIVGINLSCKETLEIAVAGKNNRLLLLSPMTLTEVIAQEHLWGRITSIEADRILMDWPARIDNYLYKHACENACRKLREHVLAFTHPSRRAVHLEMDVLEGTHILFLIALFAEQGWSTEKLFEIHSNQILTNYYEKQEMSKNLIPHIKFFQTVLLQQIKQGLFRPDDTFKMVDKICLLRFDEQRHAIK